MSGVVRPAAKDCPMLRSLILASCFIVPLSACGPAANDPTVVQSDMITISGQAAYRERIALRPGAVFTVVLEDVSFADDGATVLEAVSRDVNTEQVPLSFEMFVDRETLSETGQYSVRAVITDANDALLWTTDTPYLVTPTPGSQSLGTLRLVQAAPIEVVPTQETLSSTAMNYDCAGLAVSMIFKDDAADMTIGPDTYSLMITPAASGAQYISTDETTPAMFWDKGDTALLQIGDGEVITCQKVMTPETVTPEN